MSDLLIKMAQAATEDKTLFAHNIQQYAFQHSFSWEEVADNLRIGMEQLAKLALCNRPQSGLYNGEITQIADYVGVDLGLLKAFVIGLEGSETSRTKRESGQSKDTSPRRKSGRSWNIMSVLPKQRGWAVGVVFLLIILLGAFVFTQAESASVATLVVDQGQARIVQADAQDIGQGVLVLADSALAVRAGDQIIVSADSSAQLRLIDGSSIELAPGTKVNVDELVIDETSYRVHLELLAGRTLSRVVTVLGLGDRFEISTPSSTASVRGTIFTVAYLSADETFISCDEGKVEVALEGQESQIVSAGMEVTAVVGQPLQVKSQQAPDIQPPAPRPAPISSPTLSPSVEPVEQTEAVQNEPVFTVVEVRPIVIGPFENGPPEQAPGDIPGEVQGDGEQPSSGGDSSGNNGGDGNTGNTGDGNSGNTGDGNNGNNGNGPPESVPGNPPADPPGNGRPPAGGGDPPGQGNGNGGENSNNNNSGGNGRGPK